MNKLQLIQFNILKETIDICEKIGVKYYLACGSVLGAVKYSGFIPWDDDIDICMSREDYELFCKEAPKLLPNYYFLQNIDTDKNVPFFFSKIRDSRTTFIEKSISHININHGVYIDVFPIDGYPIDDAEAERFERKLKSLKLKLSASYRHPKNIRKITKLFFKFERLLRYDKRTRKIISAINGLIMQYSTSDSKLWCNFGNWQGKLDYSPSWHYGDGVMSEFEGLKVQIPENFDAYLTQKYGDWRADLPLDQQVGHHFCEIIDLYRPYTDYIESVSKDGMKIKLKNNE